MITTIKVTDITKNYLRSIGKYGESFDDILLRVLNIPIPTQPELESSEVNNQFKQIKEEQNEIHM